MPQAQARSISIDRHPPERGPQSVILPSVCCTCCCCCSCCLSTVGAIAGGVIALKGADAGREDARKRILQLMVVTVGPTVAADVVLSLPLIVTLVVLPASMIGAGVLAWIAYAAGIFADPDKSQRKAVGRYLGYTLAGSVLGLLALIPIAGLFLS